MCLKLGEFKEFVSIDETEKEDHYGAKVSLS